MGRGGNCCVVMGMNVQGSDAFFVVVVKGMGLMYCDRLEVWNAL